MIKQIFSLLAFFIMFGLSGQTIDDALRYSLLQNQGTARFVGTGGSMSALGVDFSTFSVNPAGIGWVRNGYFVVTPGFKLENSNARLLNGSDNEETLETKGQFALPNIGLVFTNNTRSLYWPTFNIGVGINRLADFNETIKYRGLSTGSILETFVEDANDNVFNDFRNELAFDPQVEAVFFDENANAFLSDYDPFNFDTDGTIRREGSITRTGGMSEFVLNFGGSFKDKVMWGIGLGVPFVNFNEERKYSEIDQRNTLGGELYESGEVDFFEDLSFDESLDVSGSGLNFKFGLIFRPTQALRLSVAAHSPTFWSLEETYETTFSYNFTDIDNSAQGGTALSPRSEFAYNLQTPWRFIVGASGIVGKKGFVSLDVEYASYATNKFSYDDFATEADEVNKDIDEFLTSGLSIRGGGEYNLGKLQLRAGAGLQTFPYKGIDDSNLTLAGGLGFRAGKIFIDLGYQYLQRNFIFQPYSTFNVEPQQVDVNLNRHNLLLSGGFYF